MYDGYCPDFAELLQRIGPINGTSVTIPTEVLKLLLSHYLRRIPFDEKAYAASNPDVAEAHRKGEVPSLHEHYCGTGYFEGRSPGWYPVDEAWYCSHYMDLSIAKRAGKLNDPAEHYLNAGRGEGRVGSAAQYDEKQAWERALGEERKRGAVLRAV